MRVSVRVRCYAELNDFLPLARRSGEFVVEADAGGTVKDLLEGLGVPHTEVDLLLVNGEAADFDRRLAAGDRVSAYPVFESFDITGVTLVRPEPLREARFVLDAHLGRLAAYLRLAGFDAAYARDAPDEDLVALAHAEHRILLSRDQALLKRRAVTHGSFVHATSPLDQFSEVVTRFHLARLARPFTRCTRCNGVLVDAREESVRTRVPPRSRALFARFLECNGCGRVYWEGSHYARLREVLEKVMGAGPG